MPSRVPTHHHASSDHADRAYARTAQRRLDKRFYQLPAWRKLRLQFLRANPLCVDCLERGFYRSAEHVHHTLERRDRPDLAFDWSNLEALCPPCHGGRRKKETK